MQNLGMNKKGVEVDISVVVVFAIIVLVILLIIAAINFNWVDAIADRIFG